MDLTAICLLNPMLQYCFILLGLLKPLKTALCVSPKILKLIWVGGGREQMRVDLLSLNFGSQGLEQMPDLAEKRKLLDFCLSSRFIGQKWHNEGQAHFRINFRVLQEVLLNPYGFLSPCLYRSLTVVCPCIAYDMKSTEQLLLPHACYPLWINAIAYITDSMFQFACPVIKQGLS